MRTWILVLLARIRGFLRSDELDRDFDSELEAHLAMAEEEKVRRGMTRDAARREARVELGGLSQLREAGRAARGLPWIGGTWLDLALGVRLLAKYPGLTLVSTVALAIGIAIVAGFHAGTDFFVNPRLPVPEGDRVVGIWHHDFVAADRGTQTIGDMLAWRAELESIDDIGAFAVYERSVSADGPTRVVRTALMSPSLFRAVRVPPLLGRPLVEADERPGAPRVAVIGFELWHGVFGGDPGAIGRTVRVGGVEHEVVGVMPDGFAFPKYEQLWMPLELPGAGVRPGEGLDVEFVVGRLAPDATLQTAAAELRLIGERLATAFPRTHARLRPRVSTYARSLFEASEPELPVLITAARAAILIVLLVVAVNVGTLVYARNAARVGEVSVRTALGASRRRIVLQMFLEALVLASLAAAVALAFMAWPLTTLRDLLEGSSAPYWFRVGFGAGSVLLVVGLVVLSAVLTGVLPALKLTGGRTGPGLARMQEQSAGLRFGKTATLVVVAQVAISVALLTVGAAQLWTFVESWSAALEQDGSARDEFLVTDLRWDLTAPAATNVQPSQDDLRRRAQTWRALGQRVSQEPGVRSVTFSTYDGVRPFALDGTSTAYGETTPWSYVMPVAPDYFETYGKPILAGRAFEPADFAEPRARLAIVNEEFIRRTRAGDEAIGQRIRAIDPRSGRPQGDPLEIVGIVRNDLGLDITHQGPGWRAFPTIYVLMPDDVTAVRMTVHVAGEPSAIVGRLNGMASQLDPSLVLHRTAPLADRERETYAFLRLYGYGVGFLLFAVLLLSTAGTYAMMAFTVSQRRREIGIRIALGASPRQIVGDVFSRAMRQLGIGTLLGLGAGLLASNVFASSPALAHGVALPLGIAAVLFGLGLVACGRPMHDALRVEPTEALRDNV